MSKLLIRNESTKIWIVEDNTGDLMLLQEILIDLNFKSKNIRDFSTLSDVQKALEMECPDVLLLDLFLPGSQGIETYSTIKERADCCPVIILSGLANMETALDSVKMGAQDYLIKDELNDEIINKMINYAIERYANINELKRSEEKYKLLFRSIPQPILMLDEQTNVLELNDASKKLLNIQEFQPGDSYLSFFSEQFTKEEVMLGLSGDTRKLLKLNFPDDTTRYIEQSSVRDKINLENRLLVTLVDRTEIIENQINRNRIIHETLDDERNRFSRELHDGLAQYLVVLNLNLQMLKGIDSTVDEGIEKCLETVQTSTSMVRSISYNLSPPDIEKGLIPALYSFFNRIQNVNNIKFSLHVDADLEVVDFSSFDEYSLFRIIQEFINNSIKYSGCDEIRCALGVKSNKFIISIGDNGKGFDMNKVNKGLGLNNMTQRAFAAGFKLELLSSIGEGTNLHMKSEFNLNF